MEIPQLSQTEKEEGLRKAAESPRHRHAKILHEPGDELNRAFNFLLPDSYMQPHHHPSAEKVESIHIVEGKIAVIFFDDRGGIREIFVLEPGGRTEIDVPAFTWHTYVVLSDDVITYETMRGVYDPKTWKSFAEQWAPAENTPESIRYLEHLKEEVAAL